MPDHLGGDMRKVKKEEEKEDKPIQGRIFYFVFERVKSNRICVVFFC